MTSAEYLAMDCQFTVSDALVIYGNDYVTHSSTNNYNFFFELNKALENTRGGKPSASRLKNMRMTMRMNKKVVTYL